MPDLFWRKEVSGESSTAFGEGGVGRHGAIGVDGGAVDVAGEVGGEKGGEIADFL